MSDRSLRPALALLPLVLTLPMFVRGWPRIVETAPIWLALLCRAVVYMLILAALAGAVAFLRTMQRGMSE
ncbi:MAG: hypothetical protein ABIT04_00775 [Novosphingobium sp.]